MTTPRLLLIGAGGQLGQEIARLLPVLGNVQAYDRHTLDLEDLSAVRDAVRDAHPDVVINTAAYTKVDQAERDPARAEHVNATAPGVIATEAARLGAVMIHYSTDYVFDGASRTPYTERDRPAPRTVYGRSKADGDSLVQAAGGRGYIFRVGWLYSFTGRNFLTTMRRAMLDGQALRVVDDQYGSPTWSREVAAASTEALRQILEDDGADTTRQPGVYHMSAPDHTTWYQFAVAIAAATPGVDANALVPIATADYPTPAARPPRSVLDSTQLARCFGIVLPGWRDQLIRCLTEQ